MPLYDIHNEFQKGSSHMAAVVKKVKGKNKISQPISNGEKIEESRVASGNSQLTTPLLTKHDDTSQSVVVDIEKTAKLITNKQTTPAQNGASAKNLFRVSKDIEDGEVIGIITLENVFEELLQEEIVDETDLYIDVHKRICVVAAAAAVSSVARAPSSWRMTGQRPAGTQGKQGITLKKSADDDLHSVRLPGNQREAFQGNKQ